MRSSSPGPSSTRFKRWLTLTVAIFYLSFLVEHANAQAGTNSAESTHPPGNESGSKGKKGGRRNSLCLDPSIIQKAARSNGLQAGNPDGFAPSTISNNNFINYCAGSILADGGQHPEGSCVPTPIGSIPASNKMPSVKIISPKTSQNLNPNTPFKITVAVRNIELGFFTSPNTTYYLAPQQLNEAGYIKGHVHLVAQLVDNSDIPRDPLKFSFFKGIHEAASNGQASADVSDGLIDGTYRLCTITSAMNHQPVVVALAARGMIDDCIVIKVGTGIAKGDDTLGPDGSQAGHQNNGGGSVSNITATSTASNTTTSVTDNPNHVEDHRNEDVTQIAAHSHHVHHSASHNNTGIGSTERTGATTKRKCRKKRSTENSRKLCQAKSSRKRKRRKG